MSESTPRVLIIVQNLSVPLDRRVWLECQALVSQEYAVTVICPRGPGDSPHELLDGVHIYRYRPAPEAKGLPGFALEFAYSWLRTAGLSLLVRRRHGFDVIQACNPPDTYWLLALLWRAAGVRFVFDHHDLSPELFLSRFGEPAGPGARLQLGVLRWLERMTFRVADRSVATNESYRGIAVGRGGMDPERVTVVRSCPDTTTMRPEYPRADLLAAPSSDLLAYLGIMGPQDGVDNVLLVMDELVHRRGRTDVRAVLMGFGDCLEDLRAQCTRLGLDEHVTFTGRVGPAEVAQYLSAAKVGLGPDLNTPLNNLSTMNKTMEYMAYGLPSVSFDLVETRASLGGAGILVPSGDIGAFADAVCRLLDDDDLRVDLGLAARRRVVESLDWQVQAVAYVAVFDELLGRPPSEDRRGRWPHRRPAEPAPAPTQVSLEDESELRRFLRERTPSKA
ncbi:glycosyltransferase family 4 protein [Ornithinimicrobium pekingense]|uniref:Glycosyltransferase WbuB n=1 Tax=Ornithinimicrobium pekingense TaxID=384677 RepID=A0ABQ2FAZ2_9MICO|nr:glycosyltransferase family 4 protein [Ornithinimicrobium pekingense]GGK71233.1 glycosyltransferase WbuB [Ornithinimicrobium pekingense]